MAKKKQVAKTPAKKVGKKSTKKTPLKGVKKAVKKTTATLGSKATDQEQVSEFMNTLEHPLKAEIEAVRQIIKKATNKISERIKWNAPSYYYKEDFVTFNPRAQQHVHLVFHHKSIVTIKSDLLEGDYKDRRMMYFKDMKEVKANKKNLEYIINECVKCQDI